MRAAIYRPSCVPSVDALLEEVQRGAGAAFIAEEALSGQAIQKLRQVLAQPGAWAGLPITVLTIRGEPSLALHERLARLDALGGVALLERPARTDTLLSAAHTALRARRKQYEVRKREAELQIIADNVPALIAYVDRDLIFRRVNRTYLDWFRMSAGDVVGKPLIEVRGEERVSLARAYIGKALSGQHVNYETRLANHRGDIRDMSVLLAPDVADSGEVRGFVSVANDITERKLAEQTARERTNRLRFLHELSEAVRRLSDPADVIRLIIDMTAAELHVPRCSFAEVEPDGSTIRIKYSLRLDGSSSRNVYWLPDFGSRTIRLLQSGQPLVVQDAQHEFAGTDGLLGFQKAGIGAAIVSPILDKGRLVALLAVHTAESHNWHASEIELLSTLSDRCWAYIQRARAETELQESESRFRTLADGMPNLAWMAHADGRIFWYNQRWRDYAGTRQLGDFEGWGSQAPNDPEWRKSLSAGKPFESVFPIRAADGSTRLFLTRVSPVLDPGNRIIRWFGTNTDIDGQMQIEDDLRRANEELEEFAYVASHDLQEPLRMINIYSQLLLKRLGHSETQEFADFARYISSGVHRMEELIRDLLTYSQVTHAANEQVMTRANLAHSVQQALSNVHGRVKETGANVLVPDRMPVVLGDEGQFGHVFQNLLSNALKYRKPDVTPEICITVLQRSAKWDIRVKDNGIGFEQDQAERIFGLFKRLHRDDYPGTGLGLAICRRIVERFHGRIWAESQPGVGSTFHIELPVVEGA
ncbi:hypothetical protein F183_A53920 [Bryobacterales bacterium F-183]|nr:hypothetical protein F183_A53920 [Bryobacterales bacterium F-183]